MDSSTLKKVLGQVNLPSWVNFPDFERVGWLNSVLGQLWPHVNHAASTMGRQQLDPLMRDSKPSWITSVQLDRFDMGDSAPQVSGVKVYQSESSGADEVIMELDFGWTSDAEMSMVVHPMPHSAWLATPVIEILSKLIVVKVGVEKITLNGRIRLTLKPLMDDIPIVAAIQVAFVEMPNFNFDLTLYGGDIGFLPGLEAWITTTIKDSVLRPYVLPDHYTIPLVPGDFNQVDRPCGMLFVTVVSAINVPKMDWFNGSDPYVRLFVRDKRKLKTQVKPNTTKPVWNEEFQLLVHEPEHQQLSLHMFDHDVLSVDDAIGRASFPIRNLRNGEEQEVDVEVEEESAEKVDQMMIMKLVDKVDSGIDKLRNLTHFIGKKPKDGPCTLKLKLTYYEFAKEELDQLDTGGCGGNSSFTSSSSDTLDSSQHTTGQTTPQDQEKPLHDGEEDYAHHQQQGHGAAGGDGEHVPSGARQYNVHGDSGHEEVGGDETSGARQYRVHREGEPSARVELAGVHGGESWHHHTQHDNSEPDQHPQHQQSSRTPADTAFIQAAPPFKELQHNNSLARKAEGDRGLGYRPSRPTATHERPREHTATHDRPRNTRLRHSGPQLLHQEHAPDSQPQSADPSQSRQGSTAEQPGLYSREQQSHEVGVGGCETEGQNEESPLQQSLRLQRAAPRASSRKPNARVMNVLQGGLLYVEIRKASALISKPLYMLGRPALADLITCKVTVNGEEKFTAPAKGKDAAIDETLEFILGRKEIQGHSQLSVNIEVWDYRMINHFKGRMSIPFREIERHKRIKDNYSLHGVRRGQLIVSCSWMGISQSE
ncbi:hypothetical protein ABBQ32_005978 [Trebouxia sp. C0010 RCD-2024]